MPNSKLILALFAATAMIAVLTACGGSDDDDGSDETAAPTLREVSGQEYMAAFNAMEAAFHEREQVLADGFPGDDAPAEEQLDYFKEIVPEAIAICADSLAEINSLAPPPEIEAEHQEFAAAFDAVCELTESDAAQIDAASALEEFEEYQQQQVDAGVYEESNQRLNDACDALADAADDAFDISDDPDCSF